MALQRDQMAELHETAKIYYNAFPREVQEKAKEFFREMDDNRDGKINLHEFVPFLREEGYTEMMNMSFFKKLDKDGDGALDFEEVTTLYYIIKSGRPFCLGCTQLIEGLFFTCVKCFDCDGSTFNVCPICFGTGQYSHTHKEFLDNFVLLQAKRKQRFSSSSASLPIVPAPQRTQSLMPQRSSSSYASLAIVPAPQWTQSQRFSISDTRRSKRRIAFKALENAIGVTGIGVGVTGIGVGVGGIGVGLCTIM